MVDMTCGHALRGTLVVTTFITILVCLCQPDSWFEQYSKSVESPMSCGLFHCSKKLKYLMPDALGNTTLLTEDDPCRPRAQLVHATQACGIIACIVLFFELLMTIGEVVWNTRYPLMFRASALTNVLLFLFMVLFFVGFSADFSLNGRSLQCNPGSYSGYLGVSLAYGPFIVLVCFLLHLAAVVQKAHLQWCQGTGASGEGVPLTCQQRVEIPTPRPQGAAYSTFSSTMQSNVASPRDEEMALHHTAQPSPESTQSSVVEAQHSLVSQAPSEPCQKDAPAGESSDQLDDSGSNPKDTINSSRKSTAIWSTGVISWDAE